MMHVVQACATPPHLENLYFEHSDEYFNLHLWVTLSSECSKWRLSNKWGGVAHAWGERPVTTPFNTAWYDAL